MSDLPAELSRPFRILVLDWDRFASARTAEVGAAVDLLARLLDLGVFVVAVTEASLAAIEGQLSAIPRSSRPHLYVAPHLGAEVHAFDDRGRAVLVRQRLLAPEEDRLQLAGVADVAAWVLHELADRRGIPPEDVLVLEECDPPNDGDPADDPLDPAGAGSSDLAPGGVEAAVQHKVVRVAVAAPRALELLRAQVAAHELRRRQEKVEAAALPLALPAACSTDATWLFVEEGTDLIREHEIESLFTVANGYVGVRGSLAEGSGISAPGTWVAGVFDLDPLPDAIPELAAMPDWTHLEVTVDGRALTLEEGEALEHLRLLDLRQGILWRRWRHRDPSGRITRLDWLRLASLADRHVLLQSVTVMPENYSGRVRMESSIERPIEASEPERAAPEAPEVVTIARRTARDVTVAFAMGSRLRTGPQAGTRARRSVDIGEDRVVERWDWEADIGRTCRLDRLSCVYTSRDVDRPIEAASAHVRRLLQESAETLIEAHVRTWEARWRAADVQVDGDEEATRALRFAGYHLISAANAADERVSVGARALTGRGYKGHVFWDSEIYLLPFYIYAYPEAARGALMYRYNTLPAARDRAMRLGYRGALFAWESADTGEDVTPTLAVTADGERIPILTGEQEQHISAAVAFAVWQYWQTTGDDRFFLDAGAEILLETARFWASRARLEEDGRYHIRGVIGPDEYHESVDDNAYTNVMAQWNLERGVDTARILEERWPDRFRALAGDMKLDPAEPERWPGIAADMETGFDPETGLFEQFSGFFDLEDVDLAAYEGRSAPMDVILGRERTRRSKVLKQADVVLLIFLLWDRFPPHVRSRNFRYYEPRTGHDSSLSPAIHALVAARVGDLELAERYFQRGVDIDLANNMGNSSAGVHAAAQGGLWQAAVFGFAGMTARPEGLDFDPHLPRGWRGLRFPLRWRAHGLRVNVQREPARVEVRLEGGTPPTAARPSGQAE